MIRLQPYGKASARVLIEPDVLTRLEAYRQIRIDAPESGGIFLGYRRGEHLHVVDLTEPHAPDRRLRFGFHRHADYHQKMAILKWEKSGCAMDYIGEWHTHPELNPTPSAVDIRNWRAITLDRPNPMVFLIVGIRTVWLGVGKGATYKTAQPIAGVEIEFI